MKKRLTRSIPLISLCAAAIAAVLIGIFYFRFISQRIYEDSTGHLQEIYGQVNRSFGAFVERNWGLLDGWGEYIAMSGDGDSGKVESFLRREQSNWGFTEFYFISADGESVTSGGEDGGLQPDGSWDSLLKDRRPLMLGAKLSTGQEVTVFAMPSPAGSYGGFDYEALAMSYTNADLASSLRVDAFSGKARCFVIHGDGTVLLSTQSGGSVFQNYLTYLKAASDLSDEELADITGDWAAGTTGLVQCDVGGVDSCILYQSTGYQDYILLSVVPRSAVSAGFLSVQQITIWVFIAIFLLLGASVVMLLIQRGRRRSREDRMALQYRDLMFDALSNSVDDIFMMLDIDKQRADYLSPNVERLLGIPLETAKEDLRSMEKCAINGDVFIPRDELEAIPPGGSIYRECEYMHQTTGERRWYRMTVYRTGIQDAEGDEERYIIVMSDRTQERQMNQNLREAFEAARSANEAKSNFLSNMSHDIRTPMNAIVGFSVLLEKDADQPEKVREYTHKIKASSQHLLSLINDVLDMSKIESGKTSLNLESFSLPDLLSELSIILVPQARARKHNFEIKVRGALPETLIGDKLRLNQIFINLISNAIKYTPKGGQIEFVISELPGPSPQYAKLRFEVRDNGIGMSEEFQKHVFAPFSREINSVTNKIQGTGLGMAITKNLVDLMGGIISVESTPGQGSTFTVELSFNLPEQEGDAGNAWFRRRVSRVLVADDDEAVCESVGKLLRELGVQVACASDGAAAVEAARQAHEQGEDFQVILLDWKMPGVNGVDAARQIRERIGGEVPILVLTSYDWADIEDEARAAGINTFLSKPFFVSSFLQALRPLLGAPAETNTAPAETAPGVMEGRLFLVAEDNELNAEILTEMLAMEGARCELAVDGKEALEMFKAARPGYYDLILMDVQMPVMNGYEATRAIRSCGAPGAETIPIVAMTANTFAEDVRNALDSGMDGHLAKPIDMDAVREMVGRLLLRGKSSDEGGTQA